MKADPAVLSAIKKLFYEYEQEVKEAQRKGYLKENTVKTYILHSGNFVRWCNGEFEPGSLNR
ncbi:hypothetical protein [Oscillibacter sp.]|uniref:hypothetical protein n=1 Tax=Oscillibacter sp. TaxID=1945593 RepID=UPI003392DEBF